MIDDDQEILMVFSALLGLEGYACELYVSALDYLQTLESGVARYPGPCCVLSDVKMPDLDGLELQRRLAEQDETTPLLLMSGCSSVSEAVDGFRAGALDFLLKPITADVLLAAVARALALSTERQRQRIYRRDIQVRLASLTAREGDIARRVARGQRNREIALDLAIALRTVKLYRQRVMTKLGAETLVDLVRIVDESERQD